MEPSAPWDRIPSGPLRRRLARLRALANRHPRRSAALLLALLALHCVAVFLWTPSAAPTPGYGQLFRNGPSSGDRPAPAGIPFSLGHYLEVRDLLDTLAYLRARPFHTRADTLRFLRVLERYARLDTALARRLHPSHPPTQRP